ncbi:hypothetical protein B0H16DRAFT_1369764 [Mycena metata]|uniref:Uncharacterized protein n=1 Tax=Mycena metata TaxID=1033252 RepID=A0AAD7JA60_9AGAR|nr:hypothetical protein B0H16DRAFT_1369764 [Mycena metata]
MIVSTTNIFDLQESAIRYKAVDSQTPTWLSMYQIETPGVASSEAYDAVRAKASDKEKTILAAISGLSRGTYVDVGSFTHPDATADSLPCKYVLAVGLEPTPQEEDDLNKWYEEEHMDLLAKTPGWRQGRRYKLVEQRQTGTLADKPMSKYLAIHEFEENNFLQSPEFKHATSTEWRERVMSNMVRREARVLELYKGFTA